MDTKSLYGLDRDEFVLKYREALSNTNAYDTIDDVRTLVEKLLDGKIKINQEDSLVSFIQESLENRIFLNWLIGDELIEASEVKIAGAKLINDSLKISGEFSELFHGIKYVSEGRMILFKGINILLFDVSECDVSKLKGYNEKAIETLTGSDLFVKKTPGQILDFYMNQARGLSSDY